MKIYELEMKDCKHYISGMCMVKTKEYRDCALVRCCSMCNKKYDELPCICIFMKNISETN